jgi:3-dehydroquinate synthase
MKTLTVALGDRSYPIYIGNDLLADPDLISPHIPGQQVLIVTNVTVGPLYLEQVLSSLQAFEVQSLQLPDGEQYKNLDTLNLIYDKLLSSRFDRQCTLVALGGGVVGDITGFAAATYQRGVHFVQIPTTLLAQVDSSVGGKTGVNHVLGKNMIGAFYQPRCVIADTGTLNTLDDQQLSAGIAEIIKYGLLGDPEFYHWLENNMEKLIQRDSIALAYAIERSCQDKADVVAADEKESGVRALLNLGHTFGHAIEAGMGYGSWLHGEAVATGMLMAADLSQRCGWISRDDVQRLEKLLLQARLPVRAPNELTAEKFLDLMAVDKKVQQGRINLVLLKKIGHAIVSGDYDPALLRATLEQHPKQPLKTTA